MPLYSNIGKELSYAVVVVIDREFASFYSCETRDEAQRIANDELEAFLKRNMCKEDFDEATETWAHCGICIEFQPITNSHATNAWASINEVDFDAFIIEL